MVPAGLILALLFSAAFRALHIGGHHGDAAGIALAAAVLWKGWAPVTSWNVPVLAVCVALGMLAHVAGDMCTHDGCPLLYPLSRHEFGLLPEPVRITTNKLAEHWIVSPLLLAGLAYFLWRDAGPTLGNHLAGRLPASGACSTWRSLLAAGLGSPSARNRAAGAYIGYGAGSGRVREVLRGCP